MIVVRRRPVAVIVFAAIGAILIAVALSAGNPSGARFAALPMLLAVACGVTPRPNFEGRFLADRIEVRSPKQFEVPYSEIRWIATRRSAFARKRRAPRVRTVYVKHEAGLLVIPTPTDALANEVLDVLAERAGHCGAPQVGLTLAEYLRGQTELFGADLVYTYRTRGGNLPHEGLRLALCGAAFILSFVVIAIFAPPNDQGLPLAGCWLTGIGGLLGLLALTRGGRVPSQLGSASLVISPQGLALTQADVVGELKWAEVRSITFGRTSAHNRSFRVRGAAETLLVQVEGAEIGIADCYDRPIEMIHRVLALYCNGTAECFVCGREIRAPAGPSCVMCVERRAQSAPAPV